MAYSTINKSSDYFQTNLYTANNSGKTISGMNFKPDFIWTKNRDDGNYIPAIVDAVRGGTKKLFTNGTTVETTDANAVTSFTSDGYVFGSSGSFNYGTDDYVNWCLKANGQGSSNTDGTINTTYTSANTTAGFSIVKYTGNGTNNATFGHGLGVAPKIMIGKCTGNTNSWQVTGNVSPLVENKYLTLDTSNAIADSVNVSFDASATTIKLQGGQGTNVSGQPHIAYCFAEKKGYSKFGSYVGNGSTDGTFVYTGFKPAFVMVKRTDNTSDWQIQDSKRIGYNVNNYRLNANTGSAETTSGVMDFISNGFKFRGTPMNTSGGTFIFMAFAEEPLVANVGASIPATAR